MEKTARPYLGEAAPGEPHVVAAGGGAERARNRPEIEAKEPRAEFGDAEIVVLRHTLSDDLDLLLVQPKFRVELAHLLPLRRMIWQEGLDRGRFEQHRPRLAVVDLGERLRTQ